MPPKVKSSAAVKAKPKTKAQLRRDACTNVIVDAFPDFADDLSFCADIADKVLDCAAIVQSPSDLQQALEDAIAGETPSSESQILQTVFDSLVVAEIINATAVQDTQDDDNATKVKAEDNKPRGAGVSKKRLETVFSKEIKKRERAAGQHEVSSQALACNHSWDNTGAGGMRCQVCNFETKDNSYRCSLGCDVRLCGKCWWKWKEKL
jgi:hypothetical protein